jgi:outer membrane lipoprotein carrier protein
MREIFHRTTANIVAFMVLVTAHTAFAGGLADRVQAAYRKTDSFRADFTQQTKIEVLDRDVEESGELLFAKPGKFSIQYKGKNEREYLSDANTLWIYHPKDKEVEVIENVRDMVSKEALVFLGGLGEMTQEFKVSEGKDGRLTLVPKSKSAPFSKLELTIDPQTSLVSEADLFPKSGNKSRYVFSGVRTNESVPPGRFIFKKSGVKEIYPLAAEQ